VSRLEPPRAIVLNSLKSDVCTGGPTVTVVLATTSGLPALLHVRLYVVSAMGETERLFPVLPPVAKTSPMHAVAETLDHVRVVDPPDAMKPGDADNVALKAGSTLTFALEFALVPPTPSHWTK
jgi:hypothetical protein